jgi:hypothetical protein
MRAGTALALALTLLLAGGGLAEAPSTSIRPQTRPAAPADPAAPAPEATAPAPQAPVPTPKPRPPALPPQEPEAQPVQATASPFPDGVLRPKLRPADLVQTAANRTAAPAEKPKAPAKGSAKGSVCGDPSIKGQVLEPIGSRVTGCGVAEPVKVTSVSGVVLNPPATLDCTAAQALKTWVDRGLQPAFRPAEVVELRVFGSYMCRSRNNVRGAKISEHGRGRAVDIGAFVLNSGKTITVAGNYNAQVRRAYKAACGIFGTTLGPGSDGYHEDHLHFDIASYRSGTYCR